MKYLGGIMIPTEIIQIKQMLEGGYLKVKEMDDSLFILTLSEYDFKTMQQAVVNRIKTNKYMPTIADLIFEYEEIVKQNSQAVIHEMNRCGIFACQREYEKALMWAQRGLFPEWFKDDVRSFVSTKYLNQKKVLFLS